MPDTAAASICDRDDLAAAWTSVSEAGALELAAALYGLRGSVARFATEKDDTFRLDAADGRQYVLKVAHPSEDPAEIEMQAEVLRHLHVAAPDLPVPRVVPDRDGRVISSATLSGETRLVRLMSYLPGVPLVSAGSSVALREDIGVTLARLRHALAGFTHERADRVVAWDVTHLPSLAPLIRHVDDPAHRRLLERALERFEAVRPALATLRRQVLHNDFNLNNIVVDERAPGRVGGIIDFGDTVRTAIAVDVSTALMNQLPKNPAPTGRVDLLDEARDVLRGYLRHADLTAEELGLVPLLACGRVATRALLTSWRAKLFPENRDYILRHTQAGWSHLAWFMSLSPQETAGLLLPRPPASPPTVNRRIQPR